MNTMQLSCFVEVAVTLSFSKAAENLHVSQPTVSHQVKALEQEMGCQLLVRSTRSVHLTEEGMAFLGYASDILDLADRARRRIAQGKSPDAHHLGIGVGAGYEAQLFASTIRRMSKEDEAFEPVLRMGPNSALIDMLEGGSIDVALSYRDPAGEAAGATVFRQLFTVPAAVVCADDHALAGLATTTSGELVRAGKLALPNPRNCPAAIVHTQRAIAAMLDQADIMVCANAEIALAIAASGVACAIIPDIPALHRREVSFVPIEDVDPIVIGVRVRRGRRPALLDRFIAVLSEELQRSAV